MAATDRVAGREHFPRYPRGFIALPIIQLVFSVIVLGITAYTVAVIAFSGNCLMLFTSLATLIVTIWLISALSCAPQAYNYWAALALAIFLMLFWLISFALLAVESAALFALGSTYCYSGYYDYDCYWDTLDGEELAYVSILAAAAGLGGISFLLWLINLIITSCVIHRHRRAGLHSQPLEKGNAVQMTPSANPAYAPVPQQGPIPQFQQNTAYNPHQQQPYGAPPQGFPPGQFQPAPQGGYWGPPPPGQPMQPGQYYAAPPPQSTIGSPSPVSKPASPEEVRSPYEAPPQPYQPQPQHPYPNAPQ